MKTSALDIATALYLAVRDADERAAAERVRAFVRVFREQKLTAMLPAVLDALPEAAMAADGIERVRVASARPLSKEALDSLLRTAGVDPSKSDVRVDIDPSIVGGGVVRTTHKLVNASVRGKLDAFVGTSGH